MNDFGGKRYILSTEDAKRGGSAKSPAKTLACKINPMKNSIAVRKVLTEQGVSVDALKHLVLLNSRNGEALVDEMISMLKQYRLLVENEPTARNTDSYLRALFSFKKCLFGDKLILETKEKGLTFEDLVKRLPRFQNNEPDNVH